MNLNQKIHLLPLMMLFGCYASGVVTGQGMCVPEPIIVSGVMGHVRFEFDGKQRPQKGITVEITHYSNPRRVIARTVTDSDGRFHIDGIRPGKYWLRTKHRQLIGIDVELNIVTKNDENETNDSQILFVLGADPSKMCGGGHVKAVKLSEGRK